jgi:hypothetical protein
MQPGDIYAKTEDGIREVKERKRSLPVALRSLLIMIDGKLTVGEVLERARTLGADEDAVMALERAGLIATRSGAPSAASEVPAISAEGEAERFAAIRRRLSELIEQQLGLRGYLLARRLERATSLRDLHDLVPDVAKALVKRLGAGTAAPIVAELEQLLGARPA